MLTLAHTGTVLRFSEFSMGVGLRLNGGNRLGKFLNGSEKLPSPGIHIVDVKAEVDVFLTRNSLCHHKGKLSCV